MKFLNELQALLSHYLLNGMVLLRDLEGPTIVISGFKCIAVLEHFRPGVNLNVLETFLEKNLYFVTL